MSKSTGESEHLKDMLVGNILSVRGEFGYWVFEGDWQPAQRPSWNYRKKDGGGIILDMLCHWRYVLDNLFGDVESVTCLGATHIPKRWDEHGKPYAATADDVVGGLLEGLDRAGTDALNLRVHVPGVSPDAAREQTERRGGNVHAFGEGVDVD